MEYKKNVVALFVILGLMIFSAGACKKVDIGDDGYQFPFHVSGKAVGFTETDSFGNDFDFESLKGKVILLNISTMWCGPCRRETPELVARDEKYHEQGLEIVQCIFDDEDHSPADLDDLKRWVNEFNPNYTVINDLDKSTVALAADPNNISIPINIIITRNFVVRYCETGFGEGMFKEGYLIDLIEEYL